jgi:hypothetical protein
VGERTITLQDVEEQWRKDDASDHADATFKVYEGRRKALDQLIARQLFAQAAKGSGLSTEAWGGSGAVEANEGSDRRRGRLVLQRQRRSDAGTFADQRCAADHTVPDRSRNAPRRVAHSSPSCARAARR